MIYIISKFDSERIKYVFDFVFDEVLGSGYCIIPEISSEQKGPSIYYGVESNNSSGISIKQEGLINQEGIQDVIREMEILTKKVMALLEGKAHKSQSPDIFSFIFFCLSRYEEYLLNSRDELGRFQAKDAMLFKMGLVERALVDECIIWLKKQIKLTNTEYIFSNRKGYSLNSTIDIDQAWSYAHKGWRNFPGMIKDFFSLDFFSLKRRIKSWNDASKDPFDMYAWIEKIHAQHNIKALYFVLLSDQTTRFDKNHKSSNLHFIKLLKGLSDNHILGIHPSYHSTSDIDILKNELKSLENIVQKPVKHSRQHFLIFQLPGTYRKLIEIGIENEYSMGFAEVIGYRASTGHAFKWFDLERNMATELTIFPFQIMDVSLKNYMELSPEQANTKIESLKKYAFHIDSPICIIWHNSSLDEAGDWKNWSEVYQRSLLQN